MRNTAVTRLSRSSVPDCTTPSTAVAVNALASARRAVAAHLASGAAIDEWLAREIKAGVRENAAVLAVIEMPEHLRHRVLIRSYRCRQP
jgi:hypothetical protein